MDIAKQVSLREVIDNWIEAEAADPFWPHYIHHQLADRMAQAAAAVFDAQQEGQEHMAAETDEATDG